MPEISDFQRTNSEFANSEQKYPVKVTSVGYTHTIIIFPSVQTLSDNVPYHQRDIFRKYYPGWNKSIRYNIMWYTDFLCCVSVSGILNDVMRQVDVMSWFRRRNVIATSW
jgi:hypothetical protein